MTDKSEEDGKKDRTIPFDHVVVTQHAVENLLLRGRPRTLRKLARRGFSLEHFLAGIVLRQEYRAKKIHPDIGEGEKYTFAAYLSADSPPLTLEQDVVLIVDHDYKGYKRWAVVTVMTRSDYQHRIDITKINNQPNKIPGTSSAVRGFALLHSLHAQIKEDAGHDGNKAELPAPAHKEKDRV